MVTADSPLFKSFRFGPTKFNFLGFLFVVPIVSEINPDFLRLSAHCVWLRLSIGNGATGYGGAWPVSQLLLSRKCDRERWVAERLHMLFSQRSAADMNR